MRTDILRQMVERLKTVDPSKFHIGKWKCETTACAVGHCMDILKLEMNRHGGVCLPEYSWIAGFSAIAERLGCEREEAIQLFHSFGYPGQPDDVTLDKVIQKVKQCIEKHEINRIPV